jgi:hypothetical protein
VVGGDAVPAVAGGVAAADRAEEVDHAREALAAVRLRRDDPGQRGGPDRAEQRPGGDHVGEVDGRGTELLGLLDQRRRPEGEVGLRVAHGRDVLLDRRAVLDVGPVRREPFAVGVAPLRAGAGGADVGHLGAGLDQQPGHQQLGTLIARHGHAGFHLARREGAADGRQRLRRVDLLGRDAGRLAERLEPRRRALDADRPRAHDRPSAANSRTDAT